MNHNDIRHKLSEYLDDAVSAGEKKEIEAHLPSCAECSNALDELRKTIEQMKQIGEIEAPAGMTSRIMAKVREEAERKQSIFHRLFHPLAIKLPLQTVALLFLAVTAYYLYQNINPAGKYGDAPLPADGTKDLSAHTKAAKKEAAAPAPRRKEVEQEPGYRALDMKNEYAKPAPPVPLKEAASSAAAPAPAAQAPVVPKAVAPREERTASSPAAGPETGALGSASADAARNTAAPAGSRRAMLPSSAHHRGQSTADLSRLRRFEIIVADRAVAERDLERTIRELNGSDMKKESSPAGQRFLFSLDAKKIGELKEQLGRLGALKEPRSNAGTLEGQLQIEIAVTSR